LSSQNAAVEKVEEKPLFEGFSIKAEDFFKTNEQLKTKKLMIDDEEERMFEEKTALAETEFMTCEKC
jgi:hypothetical protein